MAGDGAWPIGGEPNRASGRGRRCRSRLSGSSFRTPAGTVRRLWTHFGWCRCTTPCHARPCVRPYAGYVTEPGEPFGPPTSWKAVAGKAMWTTHDAPWPGLIRAIHACLWRGHTGCQDVDARNKSGQGVRLICADVRGSRLTTLPRFLNRDSCGTARP